MYSSALTAGSPPHALPERQCTFFGMRSQPTVPLSESMSLIWPQFPLSKAYHSAEDKLSSSVLFFCKPTMQASSTYTHNHVNGATKVTQGNSDCAQFSLNALTWAPDSTVTLFLRILFWSLRLLSCRFVSSFEELTVKYIKSSNSWDFPSLKLCCFDGDNTIEVQEKRSFLFRQKSTRNDIVNPSRYVF